MQKFFGTDGIRARANVAPMTPDVIMRVGVAVGKLFSQQGHRSRVVVGKDTRLSSYMLESALVSGFAAAGMDVFLLGPTPTPAVALLCRSMRADVGVMISASHNPFYDNGIKLFNAEGIKLATEIERHIEELIQSPLAPQLADSYAIGRVKRVEGDIYRYIEFAKRSMGRDIRLDGMRIVVDCANGATYKAAPLALWELGAEVITMHDKPNGFNINGECGAIHPKSLQKKVQELQADVGIALDGDGDRLILVDEKGCIIDGDQVLATLATSWLEAGKLRGGGIVATVMSNLGLERFLQKKGLQLIRTPVGDRFVAEQMRAGGFNVGGEQSGHIILSDHNTTGDGLVAALQILAYAKKTGKKLSQICNSFQPVPQILKNISCTSPRILEDSGVAASIANVRKRLGKEGRLIVRPSGTEPLIRIMLEGDDIQSLTVLAQDLGEAIENGATRFIR